MKKIILAAAVAGLVAVPTLVSARHGADDTTQTGTTNVRREDRREDRRQDKTTASSTTANTQSTEAENEAGDDNSTQNQTPVTGDTSTKIAQDEAQTTAQAVFPNKTVTKVETENEHGATVYSFRFSDGSRVDVDAMTGKVVRKFDKSVAASQDNNNRRHGNSHSGHDDSNDD